MRIATWNINGLRSAEIQVVEFLKKHKVDILCLQEIKVDCERLPDKIKNFDGYHSYWFHAKKPGYAGVAIYSKVKPKKVVYGIGEEEFDSEGRTIELQFKTFSVANFYFPHSSRDLRRLDYKFHMNDRFLKYLSDVSRKKTLICGDFNVAHQEADLARPKDNVKNAGFTPREREYMDKFLHTGLIDVYRELNPNGREYTWWSQRQGVRARNIGWRIDYFLCFPPLFKKVKNIKILKDVYGSDHCPVLLEIDV